MPTPHLSMHRAGILSALANTSAPANITFEGGNAIALSSPPDLTAVLPAHQADDVALVFVVNDLPGNPLSVTGADGWTELIDEQVSVGRAQRIGIFYKVLTSNSEVNPTIDWAGTGEAGLTVQLFRGVDPVNPIEVAPVGAATPNNFNMNSPSVTTTTSGACVVTSHFCTHSDLSVFGAPAGYTLSPHNTVGTHRNGGVSYLLDAGEPGLKAPGSWTNSGSGTTGESSAYSLVLRAA